MRHELKDKIKSIVDNTRHGKSHLTIQEVEMAELIRHEELHSSDAYVSICLCDWEANEAVLEGSLHGNDG